MHIVARTVVVMLASGLWACSDASREDGDTLTPTGLTATPSGSSGIDVDPDSGGVLDLGMPEPTSETQAGDDGAMCDADDIDPTNATLHGTVFAPNLEIPISGAVVYVTDDEVQPVPDETYCSECVQLACDDNFVLTEADGSFELPAVAGPGQKLVVQKGEFLHVVDIDVSEGDTQIPPEQSNLPGRWDPAAGLWIPRIAVYEADPDKVHNVLAKFGMGEVSAAGELVPGTENFTLIPAFDGSFMDDLASMRQYHIIFVPCAATKFWIGAPTVPQLRAQNIRDYVAGGGKWYATDHSNEYIKEPFPNYLDFHAPQMPDLQPAFDVIGSVIDPDMLAWLDALPPALKDIGGGNPTLNNLPEVELRLSYSGVDAVHEILVEDDEGEMVDVGPYTYVEGPCTSCTDPTSDRPMAFTGEYGCGRMMYSTFETSSVAHVGLNPQELALLYMILEIGVCHDTPPPPPPPVG